MQLFLHPCMCTILNNFHEWSFDRLRIPFHFPYTFLKWTTQVNISLDNHKVSFLQAKITNTSKLSNFKKTLPSSAKQWKSHEKQVLIILTVLEFFLSTEKSLQIIIKHSVIYYSIYNLNAIASGGLVGFFVELWLLQTFHISKVLQNSYHSAGISCPIAFWDFITVLPKFKIS